MRHILTVSRHHRVEVPDFKIPFEAPDDNNASAWVVALHAAIVAEFSGMVEEEGLLELVRPVVEKLVCGYFRPKTEESLRIPMCDDPEDFLVLVVWYDEDDDMLGFGGSSDGTVGGSNYGENRWLTIAPCTQERIAVVVDYVECQNEPSIPFTTLLRIPNDVGARDELLGRLWNKTFAADPDAGHRTIVKEKGKRRDSFPPTEPGSAMFGDLQVSNVRGSDEPYGDGDHLFLTFLETDADGSPVVLTAFLAANGALEAI